MGVELVVSLDDHALHCSVAGRSVSVPVGVRGLARSIGGDPPLPADLTNAIGLVVDHLDDVDRELPEARLVESVRVIGTGVSVLADVEVGSSAALPHAVSRADLEEVFRTLATEAAADRRLNPGLPADWVHDLLGTCCAVVAVYRHFELASAHLDR